MSSPINCFIHLRFITMMVCYRIIHTNSHNDQHKHKPKPKPKLYQIRILIHLIFCLNQNLFKKLKHRFSIPKPKSFEKPNPLKHQVKEKRRQRPKDGTRRSVSISTIMDRYFKRCEDMKRQKT